MRNQKILFQLKKKMVNRKKKNMGDYLLLRYKHDLQAYNINSKLFSKSQEVNV